MKKTMLLICSVLLGACVGGAMLRRPVNIAPALRGITLERKKAELNPEEYFSEDELKQFHFQAHTALYDDTTGMTYVGGALYTGRIAKGKTPSASKLYRSLLLASEDREMWHEEAPFAIGEAFVGLYLTSQRELVAVQSVYTAGSQLSALWVRDLNNPDGGWMLRYSRPTKSKDIFKAGVGCCTETVTNMEFAGKEWRLKLLGEGGPGMEAKRKIPHALYISKDKGHSWALSPIALPKPTEKELEKPWSASPTDYSDDPERRTVEIKLHAKHMWALLPRYWSVKQEGTNKFRLIAEDN